LPVTAFIERLNTSGLPVIYSKLYLASG